MGLAAAGLAQERDRAVLGDEPQGGEIVDEFAVHGWAGTRSRSRRRCAGRGTGRSAAGRRDAGWWSAGGLLGDDPGQELDMAPLLGLGLFGQGGEALGRPSELQVAEVVFELLIGPGALIGRLRSNGRVSLVSRCHSPSGTTVHRDRGVRATSTVPRTRRRRSRGEPAQEPVARRESRLTGVGPGFGSSAAAWVADQCDASHTSRASSTGTRCSATVSPAQRTSMTASPISWRTSTRWPRHAGGTE